MWRCIVCGYLCARKSPPAVCPICKAKKDRFEEFGQILATGQTSEAAGQAQADDDRA